MTPEQNARWQKSIPLLDYLDHHALNLVVLAESQKRIKGRRGAPCWALEIRRRCTAEGWATRESWVPDFALRSEVAMVGLKLMHPKPDDRVSLYRQLLGDFLNRALLPFEENLEPIRTLRDLCLTRETTHAHWNHQQRLIQEARRVNDGNSKAEPEEPLWHYEQHLLQLASQCVETARHVQLFPPEQWWLTFGDHLVGRFCWTHRWRIKRFPEAEEGGPYRPVADAFLAAIEAECPLPDWLP